jgi:hypothetical protein
VPRAAASDPPVWGALDMWLLLSFDCCMYLYDGLSRVSATTSQITPTNTQHTNTHTPTRTSGVLHHLSPRQAHHLAQAQHAQGMRPLTIQVAHGAAGAVAASGGGGSGGSPVVVVVVVEAVTYVCARVIRGSMHWGAQVRACVRVIDLLYIGPINAPPILSTTRRQYTTPIPSTPSSAGPSLRPTATSPPYSTPLATGGSTARTRYQ